MTQHVDVLLQTVFVIELYLYATTLLLGFKLTGQFVIMIAKMLKQDVARFMLVYAVFLLGFATAMLALQSFPNPTQLPGPNQITGWNQFFEFDVFNLFLFLIGNAQISGWDSIVDQGWGGFFIAVCGILIVVYSILVIVMLLNLLIAMMGNTYDDLRERTEIEYVQSRAQLIISLEDEMTNSDWKSMTPYWITDAGQVWLQLQIKNTASLQAGEEQAGVAAVEEKEERPETEETKTQRFAKVDLDNDGSVSQAELAEFEKQIRAKVELEVLTRLAMGGAGPQLRVQPSVYVKPSELSGSGFAREGVYNVDEKS